VFLHLGKNIVIPVKDLIAIIDADSVLKSDDTKSFIKVTQEEDFIYDVAKGNIKSYIITEKVDKGKEKSLNVRESVIYSSNISSKTLLKRAGFIDNIEEI